ncbi:MAG: lamin tail domain-containing protein, partial [Candidatus Latescibacteria bacterium]|nr:lamin tail domain-containing protein [Candidatus Latescibacterota bacterium]
EAADGRGGLAAQRYRLHVLPRPQVRIAEILSDPPQGLSGDANGDGRRHAFEDEFVELHNAGPAPIDLGGCRLADDKRPIFSFPASTILSPDARAVVFGGGRAFPDGDLRFTAGGRLGDGLGNRRDALYLIGPAGRDTLARLAYDLHRDPDQSLLGDGRTLHATWPGRTPFSPGAPRPVLQSLRPNHHALHLVRGEQRQLRLIGSYSDGGEYPVAAAARWTSTQTAIATITATGALTALDTGTCEIAVHLDDFAVHPGTVSIRIRPPLVETLRFAPTWQSATIAGDQPFIVRGPHPEKQSYTWTLNGQRLPVMAPQYLHTPTGLDSIRVQIRRGVETVSRQWIVQPPVAKRAGRSVVAAPNPFKTTTRFYFYLARAGHVRLALYNMQGQRVRILANAEFNVGAHQLSWDGRDRQGQPVATGLYLAWLVTSHTQSHAKLLLLR